jgi:hypothetical protein
MGRKPPEQGDIVCGEIRLSTTTWGVVRREKPGPFQPHGTFVTGSAVLPSARHSAKSISRGRQVKQGAVTLDREKTADSDAQISPASGAVLKVGKRRFGPITLE